MQKENEKISGIMADDDTKNSNINSMIEKLKYDVTTHSSETMELGFNSTLMLQQTSNIVKKVDQDIDGKITELENLIKKLQAEMIEMTQSVNKPLSVYYHSLISNEEGSSCNYVAGHASPEILNELKEPKRDAGFSEIANDESLLEEIKILAESFSDLMNSSDITYNVQKEALHNIKWNFPALWEDVTKSSNNNLEIAEKTIGNINRKLSKAFDFCIINSSLDTDKPIYKNTTMIESTIKSAEISHCDEVTKFFGLNSKNTSNDTHKDDKKTSSESEYPKDSTDYDELCEIINENGANDNTLSIAPIFLNTETVEALKALSDIPNTQTQSDTCEAMPKSESILKCINLFNLHNTDMSLMEEEFVKSFPRCKSEPKKCDDSYLINHNNITNVSSSPGTNISNGVRNNAKQTISVFVSNVEKTGYTNKPEASQPFSREDTLSKAHLSTTENLLEPINTPDGPPLINIDNNIDNPDITNKNLKQSLGSLTSNGTASIFSKLFDPNLKTEEPQESVMKVEVKNGQGNNEEREYEFDGDNTITYDVD